MKQIISSIKENSYLKLYLIFISLINFVYVFFEVVKSRYAQKNSLEGTIEKHQFEYLSKISNILYFLEVLLITMVLVYLLVTFIKREEIWIKHFILINLSFFISLFFINYIISVIFSAPSGNATQQLIIPLVITLLATLYLIITSFYKRIIKMESNVKTK